MKLASLLTCLLALGTAQAALHAQAPASGAPAKLRTLSTLRELKAAFNNDGGRIRIILLLSPT